MIGAEQVARPTKLEVAQRHRIARAKLGVVLEYAQSSLCVLGYRVRDQEVAVRPPVRAPNPSTDLVQLGEAEAVRAIDDKCIGVGYVETVLDDRRADEYVDLSVDESPHHVVQFPCAHLTVRDFHSRLGCERSYVLCDGVDRIDAVVEEERLPPAVELAVQRFGQQLIRPRKNVGEDRHAIARRRADE